jgi:hypothetical protein
MALSDLAVFNEQTFTTLTEVLDQQVELFNTASSGTIRLTSAANKGDYDESSMFAKVANLVRRRNPYADTAVTATTLSTIKEISVKVAAGSKPVRMDAAWYQWIQENPAIAAAALGQQLAKATMEDMLNVGISAGYAAIAQDAARVYDGSATTFVLSDFVQGAALFGDRSQALRAWVMHSKPVFDLYAANIANAQELFNYGSVNIVRDPFGRLMIITDSPSLFTVNGVSTGVNKYHTLGLTEGGIMLEQNGDFNALMQEATGSENIQRTYQSEWSFQLGVKGYSWDESSGGHAPTNASLATATNWDKFVTSNKDQAGVVIESR